MPSNNYSSRLFCTAHTEVQYFDSRNSSTNSEVLDDKALSSKFPAISDFAAGIGRNSIETNSSLSKPHFVLIYGWKGRQLVILQTNRFRFICHQISYMHSPTTTSSTATLSSLINSNSRISPTIFFMIIAIRIQLQLSFICVYSNLHTFYI